MSRLNASTTFLRSFSLLALCHYRLLLYLTPPLPPPPLPHSLTVPGLVTVDQNLPSSSKIIGPDFPTTMEKDVEFISLTQTADAFSSGFLPRYTLDLDSWITQTPTLYSQQQTGTKKEKEHECTGMVSDI